MTALTITVIGASCVLCVTGIAWSVLSVARDLKDLDKSCHALDGEETQQ